MTPQQLSEELRHGEGEHLTNRRGVVCLSLAAAATMGLIAAYQMGIIRHLPEPPLPKMDADKVDASDEAYEKLDTPDALLGLTSYAATATLAAMGGKDRAKSRPWIPLALAGKVALDVSQAAKLTWDQWARHKAFCFWCLLAAGATFATVPLVLSEARAAIRELGQRPRRHFPGRQLAQSREWVTEHALAR